MTGKNQAATDAEKRPVGVAERSASGDFYGLIRTLGRGKLAILLCAILFGIAGAFLTLKVQVPHFSSSSEVALVNRQEQVADLESVLSGLSADQSTINTEIALIRSRSLLEKLAHDLMLLDDPEFNTTLQEPSEFAPKVVLSRLPGVDLLRKRDYSEQQQLAITVHNILQSLKISNYRQSYVILITATTTDPDKSARIANRLAELYIGDQLDQKFEATEKATEWLTERTTGLKAELETAEGRIKTFTSRIDLISPQTLEALNRQMKELRSRIAQSNEGLDALVLQLARFDAVDLSEPPTEIAALVDDPVVDRAARRFQSEQITREAFFETLAMREGELRKEMSRQRSQVDLLDVSLVQFSNRIDRQSSDLVTLQQLEREAEASRLIYEHFLGRLKETRVQQGIQQADSRILSAAVPPLEASSPSLGLNLALSVSLGLMVGAAVVLWHELRKDRVRSTEELEALTGLTVLSEVLKAPVKRRRDFVGFLLNNSSSAFLETIRNLRTTMMMAHPDTELKVIMLTSSIPGEGKTTQTLGLAANFASLGERVLLIEADIRRRTLGVYFQGAKGTGLVTAVKEGGWPDSGIFRHEQMDIDILFGEHSSENAVDFFASEAFGGFLDEARKRYDRIIIDTPPVLAVTDSRVIGAHVDAILYVVRWDSTERSQISAGIRSLRTAKLPVSGLVLTQVDPKGMRRYGYGGGMGYSRGYYT
ncbi:GNVR domain-containing protein [Tropicimonas sp. TH_r6]|uniref:GumC family protein n=1 Tax=Tropicimonas sp. TH_r6 TaxID=3082085 RepID=UPI00295465FD|nr:GNVR domain-containing protein [Tropicimonas sp. TH_r6]MDV7144301.1 GNVR domain-containing protein [Tropicimonas sp. TH_r6]